MGRRSLYNLIFLLTVFHCLLPLSSSVAEAFGQTTHKTKSVDTEQLGKALEYFNAGKYHEAILIFEDLNAKYNLNARFRAYMGLCYYYEWDYAKACEHLDSVLPDMAVYAPHERSVYYYCAAESHFNLEQYEQAIPLYEHGLTLCYDNEKGDALYRIGFCYMFLRDYPNARDSFTSALAYYERFPSEHATEARLAQIRNMIKGISEKLRSQGN